MSDLVYRFLILDSHLILRSTVHAVILLVAFATNSVNADSAADCENIQSLRLANTTILSARAIQSGFKPPTTLYAPVSADLIVKTSFCRVIGRINPSINLEIWLPPHDRWNARLYVAGNGGMAGGINYLALQEIIHNHYAAVSSDLGHQSGPLDGLWAISRPDLVRDWGHRATHEVTEKAKAIINAYYHRNPEFSYFNGCSGGGRQGLMQAQRYPKDFDGILVGDPTMDFSNLVTGGRLWKVLANYNKENNTNHLTATDIGTISAAVIDACDSIDGVNDGVLEDPRQCNFDPFSIKCSKEKQEHCLTFEQITALNKIYHGGRSAQNMQIYPGYFPGGELGDFGWEIYFARENPAEGTQWLYAQGFLRGLAFEDPEYDIRTFNFDTDIRTTNNKPILGVPLAEVINATDPDLTEFRDAGRKLLHYHGWSDIGVSPQRSVDYYEAVIEKTTEGQLSLTQDFYRLFMAPGLQHCFGGPGPNAFGAMLQPQVPADPDHDIFRALRRWVENGIAPEKIIATKYIDDNPEKGVVRTRPLCPYPQSARYIGRGSTDESTSFVCEANPP